MSRTNLEIVVFAIDAFNRADWDALFQGVAPNFILDNSTNRSAWRGVHTGRSQVQRMLESQHESWDSVRMEIEEWLEAGNDIVTRQTTYFSGRDGIEVTAQTSGVWRFRNGNLRALLWFNEHADALAVVGIEETEPR